MRLFIVLILSFLVCGCSPENKKYAKIAVDKYREMYQAGNYSGIYDSTSNSLKKTISPTDFVEFLAKAKNQDLGDCERSNLKSIKNKFNLMQSNEIVLTYNTKYSRNFTEEIFVFEKDASSLELKGYKYTAL